jgi:putative serine protease PepD
MSDESHTDLPAEPVPEPEAPAPQPETTPEPAVWVPQPQPVFEPAPAPAPAQAAQPAPIPEPAPPVPPAPPMAPPVGAPVTAPPAVAGPAPAPAPAPHGGGGATITLAIIAALFMGAIAGVAGGFLGGQLSRGSGPGVAVKAQKVTVVPSKTDEPAVAAAAAAVPSVVNIDVSSGEAAGGEKGLPNTHPSVPMKGNGSGVAFKEVPGGGTYILTNNHVVDGATKLTVADSTGKTHVGTLVGRDPDTDVAVVRIAETLPVIDVGDSAKLLVGQTVVAIGSPFGFEHSVTSGVVSALGRSLYNVGSGNAPGYSLSDVIQTDAAINPGNSGGALVDKAGLLVGINTAIYSDTGQNGGIGFAIPVNTAARVADELIAGGKVGHPFIGLIGSTVDPDIAATKKLPVEQGAYVEELSSGAGAQKAGVKVGDVVTAVDGKDIRSMDDLIVAVRRHAIGESVKLTVRRGDQTLTFDVAVGDKPSDFKMPSTDTSATPGE